jgi:hypothetical protein
LTIGNGAGAGSTDKIYFSAGPTGESNGLFGVIQPVPEPTSFALLAVGLAGVWFYRRPLLHPRR